MEERIQEVLEVLRKLEKWLRGYCHAEKCSAIHECPADHEECAKKLGLDTAIAWELRDDVEAVLYWMERDTKRARKFLEWAIVTASAFANVVERHATSFPELDVLVQRTYVALSELRRLIKEA